MKIARSIYREACSARALNTYGYYLMHNGDLDKAIVVFSVNTLLFKTLPNVYDSLGEAYLLNEEPEKALKMYKKVLILDDSNEHAQKQIESIESTINKKSKEKNEHSIRKAVNQLGRLYQSRHAYRNHHTGRGL